jgi:transcriptional regulator with PAS, ATPase and Fis domain
MNSPQQILKKDAAKMLWKDNLEFAQELGCVKSKTDEALEKYLTTDTELLQVKQKVRVLAGPAVDLPVIIIGDTGTGKELIARALHGERKGKFVAVNCAGIPDTLLESEFFGSTTGAFTGATNRPGYLEEAVNGTLFLDEIGDLPLLLQCKLLRVLQERTARRLGAGTDYKVTCRFVSATNRQPEDLFATKEFRPDLYYRLRGTELKLKPLVKRTGDIKLIIKTFASTLTDSEQNQIYQSYINDEILRQGNTRSLLNYIEEYKLNRLIIALDKNQPVITL